jgi:hypothetical protein
MSLQVLSLPSNPPLRDTFEFHQLAEVSGDGTILPGFISLDQKSLERMTLVPYKDTIRPHAGDIRRFMDTQTYGMPFLALEAPFAAYVMSAFYSEAVKSWTLAVPIPADIGFDSSKLKTGETAFLNDERFGGQLGIIYYTQFLFSALTCWGVSKSPEFHKIRLRTGSFKRKGSQTGNDPLELFTFPFIQFQVPVSSLESSVIWNPNASKPNSKIQLINTSSKQQSTPTTKLRKQLPAREEPMSIEETIAAHPPLGPDEIYKRTEAGRRASDVLNGNEDFELDGYAAQLTSKIFAALGEEDSIEALTEEANNTEKFRRASDNPNAQALRLVAEIIKRSVNRKKNKSN